MADVDTSTGPFECPLPFVNPATVPQTGGYIAGRFCGNVSTTDQCCLPCPISHWVYSDSFHRNLTIAYWWNVPALVMQIFLLLTFLVLPAEKSHRHYLSIGRVCSIVMLELAFIIPLGTKPDLCHDQLTPNDMHSDMTCAWSGALLEVGALAATVWILLRSLWTNLRVCWDVHHSTTNIWLAQAFSWGIPLLFLIISLTVTGTSYRLGTTCIPNPEGAIATWFAWLMTFAFAGAFIQMVTSAFCLFVYARSLWNHELETSTTTGRDTTLTSIAGESTTTGTNKSSAPPASIGKRLAWRRVRKVMVMQWRSIVLSILVLDVGAYFGTIYVALTKAQASNSGDARTDEAEQWSACLVLANGDKNQCLDYSWALAGGSENSIIASQFMASLVGIATFALMLRTSMLTGWYDLFRDPKSVQFNKRYSGQNFVADARKRLSLGRTTDKGKEKDRQGASLVLPDPEEGAGGRGKDGPVVPEPGDVGKRHETTDWFEEAEEDEGDVEAAGRKAKARKMLGEERRDDPV